MLEYYNITDFEIAVNPVADNKTAARLLPLNRFCDARKSAKYHDVEMSINVQSKFTQNF